MFFAVFLITAMISTAFASADDFTTLEHNASVDLQPSWSTPGDEIDYVLNITNQGPDLINEVRIWKNPSYANFVCENKTGWQLDIDSNVLSPNDLGATQRCTYELEADYGLGFSSGSSEEFLFSATTPESPEDVCDLRWYVQTIDSNIDTVGEWKLNFGTTIIDTTAPGITTTIVDAHFEYESNDYIKPAPDSKILINVSDEVGGVECQSGIEECRWRYKVNNSAWSDWTVIDGQGLPDLSFFADFPSDSNHTLEIECVDLAGNEASETEEYIVDGTAPVTQHEVHGPYDEAGEVHYLNGISNITLTVTDNKFNAGGINTSFELLFDGSEIDGGEYTGQVLGPFDEEGEYTLKYSSKDLLNNTETEHTFMFTVDKTAPEMTKTIDEPKVPMCDLRAGLNSGHTTVAFAGWGGSLIDVSEPINGYFEWDPLFVSLETTTDGYATFTLEFPRELNQEPDNFDLVLDLDADDVPDMIIHWNVLPDAHNPQDDHWSYKVFDGNWSSNLELETWMDVSPEGSDDVYTITLPLSELGLSCGDELRYGVVAPLADGGYLGGNDGGVAVLVYPEDNTGDFFGSSVDFEVFNVGGLKDWYVTSDTDITLECVDESSGLANIFYRYGNRQDAGDAFDWYSDSGDGWVSTTGDVTFNFDQSSEHKLEWYCVDNVEKTSETSVQYYRVDNTEPKINKTVVGEDQEGMCPPAPNTDEVCYISDETNVSFYAHDGDAIHASHNVMCTYEVEWNNTIIDSGNWTEGNDVYTFNFNEDSEHKITIECEDGIGNTYTDVELFKVDMLPPQTTKEYGQPEVVEYYPESDNVKYRWITSNTQINLSAVDNKVGVEGIYWRYEWVSNETCEAYPVEGYPRDFMPTSTDNVSLWNYTEGNFTDFNIPETSCHVIEYFAVDKFGNTEDVERQFVMVDNEAPNATKVVGEPKIFVDESPLSEYFNGSSFDYHQYVSQDTPIKLTCDDVAPHPVEGEMIHFKVYNNGSDITSDYCDLSEGQEYCVVDENEYDFHFMEDSEHVLKFYCADALGNSLGENEQFYFVDTMSPVTELEVSEPKYEDINGWHYINGKTTINLSAYDPEPHPSGLNETYYTWMLVDDVYCRENELPNLYAVPTSSDDQGSFGEESTQFYSEDLFPGTTLDDIFADSGFSYTYNVTDGGAHSGASPLVAVFELDDGRHIVLFPGWGTRTGVNTLTFSDVLAEDTGGNNVVDFTIYTSDFQGGAQWSSNNQYGDWNFLKSTGSSSNGALPLTGSEQVVRVFFMHQGAGTGQVDDLLSYTLLDSTTTFPDLDWNKFEGEFSIPEESCHAIWYYSTDNLGNAEEVKGFTTFVDLSAPELFKDVSEPKVPLWTARNFENISVDSDLFSGDDTFNTELDVVIEDGFIKWIADLENVSGRTTTGFQLYIELMNGTVFTWGVNSNDGAVYKDLTSGTPIVMPAPAGFASIGQSDELHYELWIPLSLFKDNFWWAVNSEITAPQKPGFPSSSAAQSKFPDDFGGWKNPTTGNLLFEIPDWYVTSDTEITMWCEDTYPHPSGADYLSFKVSYSEDNPENMSAITEQYCEDMGGVLDGEWCNVNVSDYMQFTSSEASNGYDEFDGVTIEFNHSSFHSLEFMCVDKVGKTSDIRQQYYWVDNEGPEPNKTVNLPSEIWNGEDAQFYTGHNGGLNASEFCLDDGACFEVTLLTPLSLMCEDAEPHPVGDSKVRFKVEMNNMQSGPMSEEELTEEYCEEYNGEYNDETGYCEVDGEIEEFYFLRLSEHKLDYYCVDALGNAGEHDVQLFKVHEGAFGINLNQKWNLISVPYVLLNDNIDDVLGNITGLMSVWSYQNGEWLGYDPNVPMNVNTLTTLEPGYGYWVQMNDTDSFVIGGSLFNPLVVPPSIDMINGWNLVGLYGLGDNLWNGSVEMPSFFILGNQGYNISEDVPYYEGPGSEYGKIAECGLYSLKSDIWDIAANAVMGYWEPYNFNYSNPWISVDSWDEPMYAGAGYWISTNHATSYTPATSCGPMSGYGYLIQDT